MRMEMSERRVVVAVRRVAATIGAVDGRSGEIARDEAVLGDAELLEELYRVVLFGLELVLVQSRVELEWLERLDRVLVVEPRRVFDLPDCEPFGRHRAKYALDEQLTRVAYERRDDVVPTQNHPFQFAHCVCLERHYTCHYEVEEYS